MRLTYRFFNELITQLKHYFSKLHLGVLHFAGRRSRVDKQNFSLDGNDVCVGVKYNQKKLEMFCDLK